MTIHSPPSVESTVQPDLPPVPEHAPMHPPLFGETLYRHSAALRAFVIQGLSNQHGYDKAVVALFQARLHREEAARGAVAAAVWLYGMTIQIAQQRSCRLGKWSMVVALAALPEEVRNVLLLLMSGSFTMDQAMALICAPAHEASQRVVAALKRTVI